MKNKKLWIVVSAMILAGVATMMIAHAQSSTASLEQRGSSSAIAQVQSSSAGPEQSAPSIFAATPPTGESARYVLPYFYSVAGSTGERSVTVLNVYNQAGVSCDVTVEFQYATGTTDICSITSTIPAKTGWIYCSRPVNDPVAPCFVTCPNGGLTFNEGHAFIDSTNTVAACANIAIDARVIYTRDLSDTLVDSSSRVSIVTINGKNKGD